ncbi:MAG: membrane protein insertase YidC [Pontiellaceae bacterium]|jgi:YidC/Oxa1 family membrane protein insertase|nr:membrane protein insertase YidC [Pontiellaceae bacterium]
MKKNDFIIVAILVALMFAWMKFFPVLEKKYFPRPEQPSPQVAPVDAQTPETLTAAPVDKAAAITASVVQEIPVVQTPSQPEQRLTLANDKIELTVSSYGGTVVSAVLKKYPEHNTDESGPVSLDFNTSPALNYTGLAGDGILEKTSDGLRYTAALGDGRSFVRDLKLDNSYLLTVQDSFINSTDAPWELPALRLSTGPMSNPSSTSSMAGVSSLGIDTFSVANGSRHWGRDIAGRLFTDVEKVNKSNTALTSIDICPGDVANAPRGFWASVFNRLLFQDLKDQPADWVAAKNKFFVQILTVDNGKAVPRITAKRSISKKRPSIDQVAAALQFAPARIAGNAPLTRNARMYIGPKDYSLLKTQGMDQVEVMEFRSMGFWKFMNPIMYPIKVALLWSLNALYAVVRNYGVAIMLLTIIVRVLFWPITHKGTESMRRMQALQPQLKEIQTKYKENPQRLQQETMKFYKDNKVNPMGGCLPMLVQIPVFIALFVVLRSAIELRFSGFLWINDLSEPENLFPGMIPFAGSLNILPLLMTATMVIQQKLTPAAGDPQQQKMMAVMMPLMMLFFFYTMPSGLVLYWTTSNLIMIVQMLIKRPRPVQA